MADSNSYRGSIPFASLTYDSLRQRLSSISTEHDLLERRVHVVSARSLKPVESIGNPERKDFPLVKGREVMIEADFNGAKGQAFTDMPGNFEGSLQEVIQLPLADNFERAIFISTINAVLRSFGWIDATIHCRDKEPEQCAERLVDYVHNEFGNPRIGFVGLQPAMVDHLARHFPIRVTDMDQDNLGKEKYGVTIEHPDVTGDMIEWSTVVFVTGSTTVNNTYRSVIGDRPVVFYGVTVSGISHLSDCRKYCPFGH